MNTSVASAATADIGTPDAAVQRQAAQTTADRGAKQREHFLKNLRLVALSYVIDGIGLLLFFFAGTIGWLPSLIYTAAGLTVCAATAWAMVSGLSLRFKDKSLSIPQSVASQAIQLTAMFLLPEVGFMFALILFVIYVSLTMVLPVKKSAIAWAALSAVMGTVLLLSPQSLRIPDNTPFEQAIAMAFFLLTLWRCVWLGNFNSAMMQLLNKRNKELASLTAQVDRLAHHDELTGLLNRRSLLSMLRDELRRADRLGSPLSLAMIDIDHFKRVNDALGHLAGDKTLKAFAATLLAHTRNTDRFGRYGGEEFLLIVTGTAAETAQVPVERMRTALSTADLNDIAPGFSVSFSCGISSYLPGEEIETLLQRADEALYRAKEDGRNCTRLA